ncbi:unnamed protein product [Ixodes persulcatus]
MSIVSKVFKIQSQHFETLLSPKRRDLRDAITAVLTYTNVHLSIPKQDAWQKAEISLWDHWRLSGPVFALFSRLLRY